MPGAAEGGLTTPLDAARRSGLVRAGEPLLVMVSGGADSVCLLDVCVSLGAEVSVLHVNYGLREGAEGDEEFVRGLCASLDVPLNAQRVGLAKEGNLQAEARDRRYALAERLADGDYAAAHTASDQAETVLYRLAVSPGRRALLGMEPRRGRLVRPLLDGVTRADTRDWCSTRGLSWREDPSNADVDRFARARVRHEVLDALRELNPAAELNIARTAALLRDEDAVLRGLADERLVAGAALQLASLRTEPAAVARLVLREAAERAGLGLGKGDADRVLGLDDRGTTALDVPGGRVLVEYGTVRFSPEAATAGVDEPVRLSIPGSVGWGGWVVDARVGGFGDAVVDAEAVGDVLTVRSWRDGDRMRPLGLGGSKSLQDVFTDRKVPREMRRTLPVVEAESGEIAWVAGAEVVGEAFRAVEGRPTVALSAKRRVA